MSTDSMRARRLLAELFPVRWLRALRALIRGTRLHPSAVMLGSSRQIRLASRSAVGSRCRFDAGSLGKIELGQRCWLAADVELQTDTQIHIGAGTTVQRRSSILGTTRIGRGCILAPNVFISSGIHPFREFPALPIREQEALIAASGARAGELDRAVWVQDDCWLATNVVVCPGVVIGKGSVVGANAVVLDDVPPYSVVAGVPARIVGRRLDWQPPSTLDAANAAHDPYVLSGVPSRHDSGMTPAYCPAGDGPMQAAIALTTTVSIDYFALEPLRIRIGRKEHEIASGTGVLEIPAEDACVCATHLLVNVEIVSDTPSSYLRIGKIGAVDAVSRRASSPV